MALAPAPPMEDMGTAYGGWMMPTEMIDANWLCYSVGAGADISFDLELMDRYNATIRSIDPVEPYVTLARQAAGDRPRFSAYQAAITTADAPIRMQITHDPGSRSLSAARLYDSDRFFEVPGRRLESLMAEFGDDHIDLLKLDVEGSEYEIIPTLDFRALGIKLFGTQLHHSGSVSQARALIEAMRNQGYDPVAIRPVLKITFIRRDHVSTSARNGLRLTSPLG